MGKTRELSDAERGIIMGHHQMGKINREITRNLKVPRQTVDSIVKKFKNTGTISNFFVKEAKDNDFSQIFQYHTHK